MGKRSDFKRNANDYYVTPWDAVKPLLPHLRRATQFIEPCAGNGALVDHLESMGHQCIAKFDTTPQRSDIERRSAFQLRWRNPGSGMIITNPPWTREILHPMIKHLSRQAPTWLLFDADWMHTSQSATLIETCRKIVSVGRVKWIPGSDSVGKDNACWYLFDATREPTRIEFIGRD